MPPIEGDSTQIRQVVMNLITNASDAIGERSGIIRIRTGLIEADESYLSATYLDDDLDPGPYVFIEVSDTGCGMDADIMDRIFDPFFTTKFTGRGLGLAAVLGISLRPHVSQQTAQLLYVGLCLVHLLRCSGCAGARRARWRTRAPRLRAFSPACLR